VDPRTAASRPRPAAGWRGGFGRRCSGPVRRTGRAQAQNRNPEISRRTRNTRKEPSPIAPYICRAAGTGRNAALGPGRRATTTSVSARPDNEPSTDGLPGLERADQNDACLPTIGRRSPNGKGNSMPLIALLTYGPVTAEVTVFILSAAGGRAGHPLRSSAELNHYKQAEPCSRHPRSRRHKRSLVVPSH